MLSIASLNEWRYPSMYSWLVGREFNADRSGFCVCSSLTRPKERRGGKMGFATHNSAVNVCSILHICAAFPEEDDDCPSPGIASLLGFFDLAKTFSCFVSLTECKG